MPCLVHHPTVELLEPPTLEEVEGAGLLRLATPQSLQVQALQFGDQAAILKRKSISLLALHICISWVCIVRLLQNY